MPNDDRFYPSNAASSSEIAWQKTIPRIASWTPQSCDATDIEAKSWRRRRDSIRGYDADGKKQQEEGLLQAYENELTELQDRLIADCQHLKPSLRLEKGSDLGLGTEFKGIKYLLERRYDSRVKRLLEVRRILYGDSETPGLEKELELIAKAEQIYAAHLEWKAKDKLRREKAKQLKEVRRVLEEHNSECRVYDKNVPELIRLVTESPLTLTPNIINAEGMDYLIGKRLKDFEVRRRWLLEHGIDPKTEVVLKPKWDVKFKKPDGFEAALEKIIGRKISRHEKMRRDPFWRRVQKQQEMADAIRELEALEAKETRKVVDLSPKTYRLLPGGKIIMSSGKGKPTTIRPGDELVVIRDSELPGWPGTSDRWELVEQPKSAPPIGEDGAAEING